MNKLLLDASVCLGMQTFSQKWKLRKSSPLYSQPCQHKRSETSRGISVIRSRHFPDIFNHIQTNGQSVHWTICKPKRSFICKERIVEKRHDKLLALKEVKNWNEWSVVDVNMQIQLSCRVIHLDESDKIAIDLIWKGENRNIQTKWIGKRRERKWQNKMITRLQKSEGSSFLSKTHRSTFATTHSSARFEVLYDKCVRYIWSLLKYACALCCKTEVLHQNILCGWESDMNIFEILMKNGNRISWHKLLSAKILHQVLRVVKTGIWTYMNDE